jgi:hypothetical protein
MELHDSINIEAEYVVTGDTLIALRDLVIELYAVGDPQGINQKKIATYLDQILQEIT